MDILTKGINKHMNGRNILRAYDSNPDSVIDIENVMREYPLSFADDVEAAFEAASEDDFEKSASICCKLLDYKAVPEIMLLLGTDYFMQGSFLAAERVFRDLIRDYPDNEEYHVYHGLANHALGNYKEVVKEFKPLYPLKTYRPFYFSNYGDSLQQIGEIRQSRDAFYMEAACFAETGEVVLPEMLDGAFENLLYLDIALGNQKYPEDVKLYYSFLEQVEMTDVMQDHLADNIIYFCSQMTNKWYRPLFLEFITHIRDKGILNNEGPLETLEFAFASWESYAYNEDRQVISLVETYLTSCYNRKYRIKDVFLEEEKERIELEAACYEWYMCQYIPDHPEITAYIKETYPHTYAFTGDFLEKAGADAKGTAEDILDSLYASHGDGMSRTEFVNSMQRAYKNTLNDKKVASYVYSGEEPYKKIQPKVGRNDPCPCGSGKKYKKCCGK